MSKVVHLCDEAHAAAKVFCKDNSLRMSDWVAALIDEAIARGQTDVTRTPVAKKKPLKRLDEVRPVAPPPLQQPVLQVEEESVPVAEPEGVPAYAAPPFWSGRD